MIRLSILILISLCYCECVFISSSFWAPLYNPRILNYRVDIPFNPDAGKKAREDYATKYGNRREILIKNLGNGKVPIERNQVYEPIKFYYT